MTDPTMPPMHLTDKQFGMQLAHQEKMQAKLAAEERQTKVELAKVAASERAARRSFVGRVLVGVAVTLAGLLMLVGAGRAIAKDMNQDHELARLCITAGKVWDSYQDECELPDN